MLTDYWDALSHVKNEKKMMKIEETDEFTKLVAFINQFLGLDDLEKSRKYVYHLIKDLKIFSLIAPSERAKKKKQKRAKSATHYSESDNRATTAHSREKTNDQK